MTDENDELLGMFVQEAVEHLQTIEPDLLILEEKGSQTDPEIVNRLFRGVHSIKGSAGFFGLTSITKLSHIMENLLGRVRERAIEPTPAVTDSLLSGLDKLKSMIDDVSSSEGIDATEEIAVIDAILSGGGAKSAPAPVVAAPVVQQTAPSSPEEEEEAEEEESTEPMATAEDNEEGELFRLSDYPQALTEAVTRGRHFFVISLRLPGIAKEKRAYYTQSKALLESVGTLVATYPVMDKGIDQVKGTDLSILVLTVLEQDLLQSLLQLPIQQIRHVEIPAELAQSVAPKKAAVKATPAKAATPPAKAAAAKKMLPPPPPVVEEEEEEASEPEAEAKVAAPTLVKPRFTKPTPAPVAAASGESGIPAETKSSTAPSVEETLRVSVSLLDELINMAGELVLARNQLARASVQVVSQFPPIGPLVQNLDTITSRIQEKVMQARMQPVSVVFNKFPRIIRDLARKLEKKIDLELRGGEVELDKSVIEHLSDPLTHMIRNVADHAIETPKERLAAKKVEAGKVELAAYHENGMVNISLNDDGAGIDTERIKMKALEKGLITEHQADTISEQETLNLIFAPGFSTAKKVSDVSGRGVGMDVVRTNIEKLGGTVHIESKVGKGTRIVLKLPLTLAIIPAMIVSAGSQRFAIPEVGLVEIVRVTESDRASQIELVGNAPVLRLRNNLLPLVDLADTLDIQRFWPVGSNNPDRRTRLSDRRAVMRKARMGAANAAALRDDRRDVNTDRREPTNLVAYVMVINVSGNEFGMIVDEVLDSEEIVVKPLPSFFKDNPCLSATTILGDGSVSLIIDYAGLMETAKINFSSMEKAARMDLDDERRAALRERQNIILLETASGNIMGIVHSMVRRVEKIPPTLLETIGGLPYVRYDRKTFRAVYPDQVLGLEQSSHHVGEKAEGQGEELDNNLCMVVPNIPNLQAGLIFSRIIDTRETNIDLDSRAIPILGLFGSSQIDDRVVLFPDVYALFELAKVRPSRPVPRVSGSGMRALVVDDTPFLRTLTSSYLSGAGFAVDQAEDGQMALSYLRNGQYDLLVTDLNMPVMDGFELVLELNTTLNPDIPMIATTSSISSQLEQRCSTAGFVSCVPTIDKLRLLNVLATLQPQ